MAKPKPSPTNKAFRACFNSFTFSSPLAEQLSTVLKKDNVLLKHIVITDI